MDRKRKSRTTWIVHPPAPDLLATLCRVTGQDVRFWEMKAGRKDSTTHHVEGYTRPDGSSYLRDVDTGAIVRDCPADPPQPQTLTSRLSVGKEVTK